MRPLTEDETKQFFEKLAKYIGRNIHLLLDRTDGEYCFRLHNDRVYYLNSHLLNAATNIPTDALTHIGVHVAKFTHSKRIRLTIQSLPILAPYAKYKLWIKPNGEMSYLYGNNVLKAHIGRLTENTPRYAGLLFLTMADVPIGFGVAALSTKDCRKVDSNTIVAFHQTDVGEYLRSEDDM